MPKVIQIQRFNCEGFYRNPETGLIEIIDDKVSINIEMKFLDSGKTKVGCRYCLGKPKKCYKGGKSIKEKFVVRCPYVIDFSN